MTTRSSSHVPWLRAAQTDRSVTAVSRPATLDGDSPRACRSREPAKHSDYDPCMAVIGVLALIAIAAIFGRWCQGWTRWISWTLIGEGVLAAFTFWPGSTQGARHVLGGLAMIACPIFTTVSALIGADRDYNREFPYNPEPVLNEADIRRRRDEERATAVLDIFEARYGRPPSVDEAVMVAAQLEDEPLPVKRRPDPATGD